MKNFLLVLCMAFLPMHIMANTQDTIIGRPLKSFDLSAFCSYNSFHPSEYRTNWTHLVFLKTEVNLDCLKLAIC